MLSICVILALILSAVNLLFSCTILNRDLRSTPLMWYMFHMLPLCLLVGFILHPFTYFGVIFEDLGLCYFVMYAAEYMFFGLGIHLLLFNIEVYFTKVLPLPKWQSCTFYRFVIMTLIGWLVASLLVTHVVIDNNHAKKLGGGFFCLIIPDRDARMMRVVMRELLSGCLCFVVMVVNVGTVCLKRSRMLTRWRSGELREIRSDSAADEMQWVRCIVFVNVVWMIRAICMAVAHISVDGTMGSPVEVRMVVVMLKIHALSLYFIPFAMLFIEPVRKTLGVILMKLIHVVSLGHLRFGDDTESLAVSFGNINVPDNS